MEVEAMEEGEINDEAGEEVVMEDMDYAELKNKFCQTKEEGCRRNRASIVIRRGTDSTM
jgi:hypothetical protein